MKQALTALEDAASTEDKINAKAALIAIEKRMLQTQVADFATSRMLWEKAVAFATAHHRAEPTREQAKGFMAILDADLRAAVDISPPEKYDMRIKPREWRFDVQRMFNIAYRTYVAHDDYGE